MKALRYYLIVLCGISPNCVRNTVFLESDVTWKWYDLVCELIDYARSVSLSVLLKIQLAQIPCLLSVLVYADIPCFDKYQDEYLANILLRMT